MKKTLIGLSAIAICYSGLSLAQYSTPRSLGRMNHPMLLGAAVGAAVTIPAATSSDEIEDALEKSGVDPKTAKKAGKKARKLGAPPGLSSSETKSANTLATVTGVAAATEQGPSGMSG